jgi:hypothetical protein
MAAINDREDIEKQGVLQKTQFDLKKSQKERKIYAVPLFYYAAKYRNISADKLQRLAMVRGNRAVFTNRILRPETLTLDYCLKLCGIMGIRLDVLLALLFSIYKNKKPNWYYKIQPPKKTLLKEDAKYRKRYSKNKPMAYHNIERNAPLIYYTQTMGISGRSLLLYLKFRNSNALANHFRWPTQMSMLHIIRLTVLTNQPISVTLNRLLSNMGQQDSFMFIRAEKVDNIIPVPLFKTDEQLDEVKEPKKLRKIPLSRDIITVTPDTPMYQAIDILLSELGINGQN